ncbi:DEAD/DEAH box helicase family protein [Vibrio atlanticus]|uniref:DEAD/DEAH box helicase n=1 Tax=Vibrio atlanticus TaxID=693153 RepID=A0A1C3IK29_9VIBR|nr:DEAD/DEAH box helicase family protein [Vibrio atlanticus]SBS61719.1 DEAD/DEAH box helicase [Vibrio atlanticus]
MTKVPKSSELLDHLPPVYFPNETNIVDDLFLPVAKTSFSFDCLSGYFSSKALSELAEPLAYLFEKPSTYGRFIISPNLSEEDKNALLEAYSCDESILHYLVDENNLDKDAISKHTLEVMKYLISKKRLDIRIVLMKKGMMHAKIWLFNTSCGKVAIHGSGNATKSGLMTNFEQLIFSRAWDSNSNNIIIDSYQLRFLDFWDDRRNDSYTLKLNDKTVSKMFHSTKISDTSNDNFNKLLDDLKAHIEGEYNMKKLTIPKWLNYRTGEYKHQGEAIDAWLANNNEGILSIATGGGKTLTSLAAASLALSKEGKALIVITVPTKPLISQWAKDVTGFGLIPLETTGLSSRSIIKEIKSIKRELRYSDEHKVVILTHSALKNADISQELGKFQCLKMLIADEAHNLGSSGFLSNLPTFFDLRLALSATIERQYDEAGTLELKNFFGEVVYDFPVEKAIGKCLVPFKYFVHKVYLDNDEVEKWIELSQKIRRLYGFGDSNSEEKADLLAIRRRAISENASEKISSFHNLFKVQKQKEYTLVFCTDKDKDQLISINQVLRSENVRYRQVTSAETCDKKLTSQIIDDFSNKELQVLTSKRVLDEGFNIPPIQTAYIVSSNGVERQWLQRLGRVLRKSEQTGKTEAIIHDFIVIPPNIEQDKSLRTLINNELKRVIRFSELSKNGSGDNGSLKIIQELTDLLE